LSDSRNAGHTAFKLEPTADLSDLQAKVSDGQIGGLATSSFLAPRANPIPTDGDA